MCKCYRYSSSSLSLMKAVSSGWTARLSQSAGRNVFTSDLTQNISFPWVSLQALSITTCCKVAPTSSKLRYEDIAKKRWQALLETADDMTGNNGGFSLHVTRPHNFRHSTRLDEAQSCPDNEKHRYGNLSKIFSVCEVACHDCPQKNVPTGQVSHPQLGEMRRNYKWQFNYIPTEIRHREGHNIVSMDINVSPINDKARFCNLVCGLLFSDLQPRSAKLPLVEQSHIHSIVSHYT